MYTDIIRELSQSRYDNDWILAVIYSISTLFPVTCTIQPLHVYYIWPGQALKTEDTENVKESCSDQFRVETLGKEWLSLLISTWKFSDELTEKKMNKLFELQRVFGVFVENHQEPVSWVVLTR